LAFLEEHGCAYVSVDAPATRASNVVPRVSAATHRVAYIRFHGRNWKTWNIRGGTSADRFDWLYSPEELEEWVRPIRLRAEPTPGTHARDPAVYRAFAASRSGLPLL